MGGRNGTGVLIPSLAKGRGVCDQSLVALGANTQWKWVVFNLMDSSKDVHDGCDAFAMATICALQPDELRELFCGPLQPPAG